MPGSLAGSGVVLFEQLSGGVPNKMLKTASVMRRKTSAAAIGPLDINARRSLDAIGTSANVTSPFWIADANPVPSAGKSLLLYDRNL